ncbi:GNAT family N-acetyltransferase [Streptosporangium sp. NPDC051023]|uniref:GNAT family N-acetyltransferase n=1 Tax=Streptosporangium sp. NPDC051023 TaxID=3155410 RepID=UPI003450D396
MSSVEIRTVPESDVEQVFELSDIVFHQRTDEREREERRWRFLLAHRVGAYDGDLLVGFMACLPLRVSVPGGILGCSGVTFVAVLPTHRRQGVLTAMLERLWSDTAERGEPLAALYASEAAIYGRFGFGAATRAVSVEIATDRPLGLRVEPDPGPLRLISPLEAPKVLGPLYGRAAARRAGQFLRDERWWAGSVLAETDEEDQDLTAPRVVILGEEPRGYAVYRSKQGDDSAGSPGVVQLVELEADTVEAEAALWRYLASVDLTSRISCWARPVDDPLPLLAADPDQVTVTRTWPALWLRLADLKAALTRRGWARPVEAVLEVRDERVPANHGRWSLRAGPGGASCARTSSAPDLTLAVRDLASAYLGDVPVRRLVAAGLAAEHTPGTAERLDAALATPLAPFAADQF